MTRILLVDDDANLREALRAVLDASGHEVVVAPNGREALRLARDSHPQVIVSDVTMPLMDGIEMTRRIRTIPASEPVPVVLMSARAAVPAVPVAAMLRKPFAPSELLAVLDGLAAPSVASAQYASNSPPSTESAEGQWGGLPFAIPGEHEHTRTASARERRIQRGVELVRAQERRLQRLHSSSVNPELAENCMTACASASQRSSNWTAHLIHERHRASSALGAWCGRRELSVFARHVYPVGSAVDITGQRSLFGETQAVA
ncbi:response regulator [Paraburkholderia phymatum]|uniref:response regulator n=1 Tax=Paraburkholderia phymatum TaxID=148447 RepID=UPI003D1686FA